MANTTNYSWETPDDTDLVKDGAAAIRTLGTAIDTTVFNNASAAIAKTIVDAKGDIIAATAADTVARLAVGTDGQVLKANSATATGLEWATDASGMTNPMTTTGDTIYSSSGSTPARLGIGTTGQVLTVSGGVPTWSTPSGGSTNWSALNPGGTSLTAATTITVSGISGKDKILIVVSSASANAGAQISARFNTDTGTNYNYFGNRLIIDASYASSNFTSANNASETSIPFAQMSTNAGSTVSGYLILTGGNTTGDKVFNASGGATLFGESEHRLFNIGGWYSSSSTISSISIFSNNGNFDNGTVYVYTSA
jgi:hypothetical protein